MPRWRKIQEVLEAAKEPCAVPSSEAFWAEFRRRASSRPQAHRAAGWAAPIRWALAAAAAVLVGLGFWMYPFLATSASAQTSIETLEVDIPHQAVMIVSHPASYSTILWIVPNVAGDAQPEEP